MEKKGFSWLLVKDWLSHLVNSDLWVTTRARDHYSCLICELSFLLLIRFDVLHFMGYNLIQWIFVCETWMCMRLDSTYLDQESWLADLKCQGEFSSFIIYASYLIFIFSFSLVCIFFFLHCTPAIVVGTTMSDPHNWMSLCIFILMLEMSMVLETSMMSFPTYHMLSQLIR